MYTLPSSPADRKADPRASDVHDGSLLPDVADEVIGTDSMGADVFLSDLDPLDRDEWLGRRHDRPRSDVSNAPAASYMMSRDLAEFLAYPDRALD